MMETAALSLPIGVLSLSLPMVRLGVSAVTGAVRAENPRDPAVSSSTEETLSLSSEMLAENHRDPAVPSSTEETLSLSSEMLADNPRDPAAMAASPCTDRNDAVTVVSKDGRVGSDDSCWG